MQKQIIWETGASGWYYYRNILRCPPGWGLGVRLTTPPRKKILLWNLKRRPRPTQGCRADDDDDDDYDARTFERQNLNRCRVDAQTQTLSLTDGTGLHKNISNPLLLYSKYLAVYFPHLSSSKIVPTDSVIGKLRVAQSINKFSLCRVPFYSS
jgi:hypothetical protein